MVSQDEVLDWLKQEGLSPIRIRRLSDAKHIFSHIEWHMTGYVVLVEELENYSGKDCFLLSRKEQKKNTRSRQLFQLTQPIFRSDSDRKNMTKNKTETCMEEKT